MHDESHRDSSGVEFFGKTVLGKASKRSLIALSVVAGVIGLVGCVVDGGVSDPRTQTGSSSGKPSVGSAKSGGSGTSSGATQTGSGGPSASDPSSGTGYGTSGSGTSGPSSSGTGSSGT